MKRRKGKLGKKFKTQTGGKWKGGDGQRRNTAVRPKVDTQESQKPGKKGNGVLGGDQ